jgi:hypothetical protein
MKTPPEIALEDAQSRLIAIRSRILSAQNDHAALTGKLDPELTKDADALAFAIVQLEKARS